MTIIHNNPFVGYSVLRTGEGGSFEACIVLPHVEAPTSLSFDAISRRLDLVAGEHVVCLPEIPADIANLLSRAPSKVTVVTTDALSSIRSSCRADELVAARVH